MIKHLLTTLFYTIICCGTALAQYEAPPVWSFGHHAGIDFRSTTAAPVTTAIETHSAVSATQCDANGDIMFYANGFRIWDKAGNPMPNSVNPLWPTNYVGGWSLHAFIVPDAGDTNKYFVFQIFPSKGELPYGPYYTGQLTYSVVDMRLNNGLGDVVSGMNHILLDTLIGHYLAVIPGARCNYWVVSQGGPAPGSFNFKAYEVNAAGVNHTPVISDPGTVISLSPNHYQKPFTSSRYGNMIYSHTRNMIITAYPSADIVAYNFDPLTGKAKYNNTLTWAYPHSTQWVSSAQLPAICLSPNEQFLYMSGSSTTSNGFMLRQFPLVNNGGLLQASAPNLIYTTTSPDDLAIQHSFGFVWMQSAMQLGADKKIYHTFTLGQNFVGRIENPDVAGAGCNFFPHALMLAPGTFTTSAFPSPMYRRKNTVYQPGTDTDTTICFKEGIKLTAPAGYDVYVWSNGQTTPEIYTEVNGKYTVASMGYDCRYREDTFEVNMVKFGVWLGEDVETCEPFTLTPVTEAREGSKYRWQDGSDQETFKTEQPGKYWVQVDDGGCVAADTIEIIKGTIDIELPDDTTICNGTAITINAAFPGATAYRWQDSSTAPAFTVSDIGVYTVEVTKGYCTDTGSIFVNKEECDKCLRGVPTAFTPNNDGLNDQFRPVLDPMCPLDQYQLRVFNRFGEMMYNGSDPKKGWDGYFKGTPQELGAYFYFVRFTGPDGKKYFHKGDVLLVR